MQCQNHIGCELVSTLPWFDAGGSSPKSVSLVAPVRAETDKTLAANNCDTDGKTSKGFLPCNDNNGIQQLPLHFCQLVNIGKLPTLTSYGKPFVSKLAIII